MHYHTPEQRKTYTTCNWGPVRVNSDKQHGSETATWRSWNDYKRQATQAKFRQRPTNLLKLWHGKVWNSGQGLIICWIAKKIIPHTENNDEISLTMEHRTLQNEVPFPRAYQSSLQSVCIIRYQIHLFLTALCLFATKKETGCDFLNRNMQLGN